MTETTAYRPITLPNGDVVGGELLSPAAVKAGEKASTDEANRGGWMAALTGAYSKRAEVGDAAVTANLAEIVQAALANGLSKSELAGQLRSLGVDVMLKPETPAAAAAPTPMPAAA